MSSGYEYGDDPVLPYYEDGSPLSPAAAERYAAEHPEMAPRDIGWKLTARLSKAELRGFAAAHVASNVGEWRRAQARRVEAEAQREAERREQERREQAERQRLADYEASARERRQAEWEAGQRAADEASARLGSEEFFRYLADDPVGALGEVDKTQDRFLLGPYPGYAADKFRDWLGDRFGPWMDQAEQALDERDDQLREADQRAREAAQRNEQASLTCERHPRRPECTGGPRGSRCHRRSVGGGLCAQHGGVPEQVEEGPPYANTGRLKFTLQQTYYPGGAIRRRTDRLIAETARETRLEVTAELLGTKFQLGDGTAVSWGEATVEQHRQYKEMLAGQIAGTAETAARHEAAIAMITEAGATCLRDIADGAGD